MSENRPTAPLLDIIVTHYDEPWEVGKGLFEMLRMQRGVRPQDVRVTIIHDGKDIPAVTPEQIGNGFPFAVRQGWIEHAGISAARNTGIRHATAPWVMFCDWDDRFTSTDALRMFVERIVRDDADMIQAWIANETETGSGIETNEIRENDVFIHAKAFRRDFLDRNGIRFAEDVGFSEDSLFCDTVRIAIRPDRVSTIHVSVYLRTFRAGSQCHSEERNLENCISLFNARRHLTDEYRDRDCPQNYMAKVCRTIADFFFATTSPTYPEPNRFRQMAADYIRDYLPVLTDACLHRRDILALAYLESRTEAVHKGMLDVEHWTFWDWFGAICQRYHIRADMESLEHGIQRDEQTRANEPITTNEPAQANDRQLTAIEPIQTNDILTATNEPTQTGGD